MSSSIKNIIPMIEEKRSEDLKTHIKLKKAKDFNL